MGKVRVNKVISVFIVLMLLIVSCVNYPTFSASADDYEYAWFPVNQVRLTQLAFESYSHSYSYHFDCVGSKAVGSDYAFAPFTGKIVYTDASWGFCGLQSTDANGNPKKVYWADGSLDYMTVWFMHGSNVSSLSKGQIIPQGTEFFREGSVGASSAHYDIGVSRGQITTPKDQTGQGVGNYCGCGSDYPYNAFFLNRAKTPTIVNPGKLQGRFVGGSNNKSDWTGLWRDLNTTPPVTGMTISGQSLPPSPHTLGNNFGVYGVISSNLPISLVWGGVYKSDWTVTDQYAEASPNTTSYNLHGYFNDKLIFDYLPAGSYHYLIKARDTSGTDYELINHDFTVVDPNVKTYTIKYDANTDTGTMENSNMTYGQAANLRKNTFTKTGYSFESWSDGNGNYYSDQQSVKNLATSGTVTLWAKWKANTITVKYDANSGTGTMENSAMTYDKAAALRKNTYTRKGYTFESWSDGNGNYYSDQQSVKNLATGGTVTLWVKWKPNTYTVKFNANGGSGTMSNLTMTYDTAKNLTANAFKRDGYTFLGWSTDKAATKATYTDKQSVKNLTATANGTVTLYAVWSDKTAPKITKAAAESVSMTGFKITATVSDAAGLKSVTANVNSWRGIDVDGKSITLKQSNGIWTADVKISDFNTTYGAYYFTVIATDTNGNVAKSDSVEVKIGVSTCTFDPNGGKVDPASKTLVYGEKYSRLAKLPTPSRTGYIFDGWYTAKTGGTKITDNTVVTETKDHTLYAHWTAKTIKVTFHHNRNSNDTNTVTETFIYGVSNQKFGYMTDGTGKYKKMNDPAVGFGEWTNPGYTLLGWNTDKTATAQLYSTYNTVGNDWINQKSPSIDLYAVWKANSYTVTFNANSGTVDPANKKVSYNASYGDLPSPTWKGHLFQGWFTAKEGGTQVTKDTKYTLTADQTLYAQWKLNGYSVKFDAAGGTVSTASIHVTYSKAYGTLPTPELKGYRFVGWFTEEGTEVTDKTTVTINHDHTLTAHWKLNVPENLELRNGDQYQLDMPDEALTYRSNNANVAVVSKSGIITAVGKGEAIITVLDAEDNAYQVKLTVLPVMLQGDINLDGQVNIADAILLQKWLLAVPDTKLPDWRAGDLYADNRLDVFDLCLLKRMLIYG